MADELITGTLHRFADWPTAGIPSAAAGEYTIWDHHGSLIYVGMSGRGLTADHLAEAAAAGKRVGLWNRLHSHASGRRSGDQFCIYVCDRLILPTLTPDDIARIADDEQSLDTATREHIRTRFGFRDTTTPDGTTALDLEHHTRAGGPGPAPLLNPVTPTP